MRVSGALQASGLVAVVIVALALSGQVCLLSLSEERKVFSWPYYLPRHECLSCKREGPASCSDYASHNEGMPGLQIDQIPNQMIMQQTISADWSMQFWWPTLIAHLGCIGRHQEDNLEVVPACAVTHEGAAHASTTAQQSVPQLC